MTLQERTVELLERQDAEGIAVYAHDCDEVRVPGLEARQFALVNAVRAMSLDAVGVGLISGFDSRESGTIELFEVSSSARRYFLFACLHRHRALAEALSGNTFNKASDGSDAFENHWPQGTPDLVLAPGVGRWRLGMRVSGSGLTEMIKGAEMRRLPLIYDLGVVGLVKGEVCAFDFAKICGQVALKIDELTLRPPINPVLEFAKWDDMLAGLQFETFAMWDVIRQNRNQAGEVLRKMSPLWR